MYTEKIIRITHLILYKHARAYTLFLNVDHSFTAATHFLSFNFIAQLVNIKLILTSLLHIMYKRRRRRQDLFNQAQNKKKNVPRFLIMASYILCGECMSVMVCVVALVLCEVTVNVCFNYLTEAHARFKSDCLF